MMKFTTNSEVLEHHEFIEAYELDDIIIGKYRVMFGYRIRGGFVGDLWYEFDLCCGAQEKDYKFLLEKLMKKILSNPKDDRFKGIPNVSKIKPYFNDDEFLEIIEQW